MSKKLVHVAAAVIRDSENQILIAKRPDDKHQGGFWEFPGGKVESDEAVELALVRELEEELGIQVEAAHPLIQVPYHYPDKSVLLDVYEVTQFQGEAWGKEGQPVQWVSGSEIESYQFPAANQPILNACLLPGKIAITPFNLDYSQVTQFVGRAADGGAGGVLLRIAGVSDRDLEVTQETVKLYVEMAELCQKKAIPLFVSCSILVANQLGADAVHLSSTRLEQLGERAEFKGRWLSASCHNVDELNAAQAKGLDFVTLSPVQATCSHPDANPLGWEEFAQVVSGAQLPVYALGGMKREDFSKARNSGAQGIAAISAW